MIILGLHGGEDFLDDHWVDGPVGNHDAGAVLLVHGELVAAVEEERLNRVKHTNKAPVQSIAFCLDRAGVSLRDVDVIAIPQTESDLDGTLLQQYQIDPAWRRRFGFLTGRQYVLRCLERCFGTAMHPDRLYFTHHHVGHASSSFYASGFDEALVVTLDGYGGSLSGLVSRGSAAGLEPISVIPGSRLHGPAELMEEESYQSDSLGLFYLAVTEFLGFQVFDEYKVMGLAPYGDASALGPLFRRTYSLLPGGRFRIHWHELKAIRDLIGPPPPDRVFERRHQDAAAGIQEALTDIVLHMLRHLRADTGLENLCLAGGVGLNCTLNGAILRSGLWRRVFVQPAANDGGLALGAALDAHHTVQPAAPRVRFGEVYLGPDCGESDEIARELARWQDFVTFERIPDIEARTAAAMAEGAIVGWVQGRAEFGPRALGNRSILADPRPRAHIARINEMVKKREAFRPFAPAVLEEYAARFFELPSDTGPLNYMLASVKVRDEHRAVLGATTHVDGSARIQIVRRAGNPRFWALIQAFHALTGVPVLLNTSFNNNSEPIVTSPFDAIVCFLTTDLTLLVIGDYIARKRPCGDDPLRPLTLTLSRARRLRYLADGDAPRGSSSAPFWLASSSGYPPIAISPRMFSLLSRADGAASVDALIGGAAADERSAEGLLREIRTLWGRRAIVLTPPDGTSAPPRRGSTTEPAIRDLLADELTRCRQRTEGIYVR